MSSTLLQSEKERLAALQSYSIKYELPEKEFDELTRLAAIICNKPIANITFIDEQTQWIKSSVGLEITCTDRETAFCNRTIQSKNILEIKDASLDPEFKNNPFVIGNPHIRFYAGAPLITSEGYEIGSLCVIDQKPGSLSEDQREALTTLSHSIISLLENRKQQKLLIAEKQKAEEASKAKADFLSTMSHEIRTPLNGISGIAHLLMEEDPAPHQIEYIKTLKFSASNLMSIVNDILDFSKIEAGKITIEKVSFNLVSLLSEIKNANHLRAQDKQIKLKLRRDDDMPEMVIGDPVRLAQILNNLVSNAIKFTHRGEVTIDVQLESIVGNENLIKFIVKDTGIGIPVEKQGQLFKEFSQVDATITRRFGGTGLGLVISKRLLELQNSSIKVKSEVNVGSEFSFLLNFTKNENDLSDETRLKSNPSVENFQALQGTSILIAEDNQVNILIAKKIMKNWGVVVHHAQNGLEAIALLQRHSIDIILMDLQMPIMDGYEATKKIREIGYTIDVVPIIALTASAMLSEKNQALDAGMNDFITKPFNPAELYDKLKRQLTKK
jgi:signal transduction histidine kinase/ActR/RegA family two-component response regulator